MISANKILFRRVLFYMSIMMVLSTVMSAKAYAGVVLGNTRIIYPADSSEVTLGLKNTETSQTFLVQSVIEDARGEKQQNFVVTPPLFVLKPGSENKLRIFHKTLIPMAGDRETLFWMSIKAIPSASRQEDGNFVQFAVTNRIKLLYRPKGLKVPDDSVWKKISFSRRGNDVVMHNPTRYYMNIGSVKAGDNFAESLTLAPDETKAIFKNFTTGKSAEVIFINDFGGESEKVIVPVS